MGNRILSISVAAYNVSKYIRQCLDSFLDEELFDRVEVLVTDDGSSDETPDIVGEYEKKYPGTFRLISQKNAGPGSTVNSGIKNASGKYFRMVDGDDWVNTGDLKKLVLFLEKQDVDMICTHYCCVDHETGEKELRRLETVDYNRILNFKEICGNLSLEMHNVIFRTQILQDNKITLDNGFYTDVEYLLLPTPYIESIVFLDLTIYMYRVSLSTQSMNIHSLQKNVLGHRKVFERLIDEYKKYNNKYKMTASVRSYLVKRIVAMGGTQLSIYLSFSDAKKYKMETKEMMNELKQSCGEIYHSLKSLKTYKILEYSNYMLYPLISYLHRKKLGLIG